MSKLGTDRISALMRGHRPRVMDCNCVTIGVIVVKSGVAQKSTTAPRIQPEHVPFHTRTAGAAYQDQKHGRGMRLHNPRFAGKPRDFVGYTCTVCGRQKGA